MPKDEFGEFEIDLFATLRDQLTATKDPRDAERAELINAMLEARGDDLSYNPQKALGNLLAGKGMIVMIGVSPKPPIYDEQTPAKEQQPSSTVPDKVPNDVNAQLLELAQLLREREMAVLFKPHCKEPEQFEACRKLMAGEDMTGWEAWTAIRIIQTNNLPVYFVPPGWLKQ